VTAPSVGRIVLVRVEPDRNNGSDVAPAIITRVWNDSMVNVKVFLDGPGDAWQGSVTLWDEKPTDEAIVRAAWWPPRVG
jgi:hypothetical protein